MHYGSATGAVQLRAYPQIDFCRRGFSQCAAMVVQQPFEDGRYRSTLLSVIFQNVGAQDSLKLQQSYNTLLRRYHVFEAPGRDFIHRES
jgi:hypothetical protein